ncbi:unnamed protein product [Rotaria magnacalcarata]|uniref:Endonuclease/exonuclease/phosphatase domain-containing protein n=1 Tax=Rotaria magnacalcarata TaxID=392030 RepID=A0A817AW81_9BILA|nr:unnamed protein product [Rotaria magnacalcarata]
MTETNIRTEKKFEEMNMRMKHDAEALELLQKTMKNTLCSIREVMEIIVNPLCELAKIQVKRKHLSFTTILKELQAGTNHRLSKKKNAIINTIEKWNFTEKDKEFTRCLLDEWYSGSRLSSVLQQWEENNNKYLPFKKVPLNILFYNVEGWGTRYLEVVDLVYKVDASISVLTEVGELWNKFNIRNFNAFHQQGTNPSGGVCVSVGKHLRATQIQLEIENTVFVDVFNLSDPIRIIGIYWPQGQEHNLDDLSPYITQETIITGDFNASLEE